MGLYLQDFTHSDSILIVDRGRAYNPTSIKWTGAFLTLDRLIYLRLQNVDEHPIGTLPQDSTYPLKDFFDSFNTLSAGLPISDEYSNADIFLGSLGITQYYPHSDNIYKGELVNG